MIALPTFARWVNAHALAASLLFGAACTSTDPTNGREEDAGQADGAPDGSRDDGSHDGDPAMGDGDGGTTELHDASSPGEDASAPDAGPCEGCGRDWTLLVYMAADNNLESSAIADLGEMMAIAERDNVEIIVQIDRAERYHELGVGGLPNFTSTKRLRIRRGSLEELADLGETNTGDPAALSDFITFGARNYPARHMALVLWDHGNAWLGYGGDEGSPGHDRLTLAELEQAVRTGVEGAERTSFDFIGFDACLMSTYETLRIFRPFTRYFIASQEVEPSNGWDYRSFATLADDPEQTMLTLGHRVLTDYEALSRAERRHTSITLSLHDLDQLDALEEAFGTLMTAVRTNLDGRLVDVGRGRAGAEVFGYHADPTRSYEMVDLGDWARLLAQRAPAFVTPAARITAALDALVVAEVKGRNKERASGVSVYFPKLAAYYKPAYDQIASASAWRTLLTSYYEKAGRLGTRPTFKLGLSKGLGDPVPTPASCGDGLCQIAEGEDSANCASDCAGSAPEFVTPDCDALEYIPATFRLPAQTAPICEGSYMFWCTQEDGAWHEQIRNCPVSERVCGAAWDDPLDPGNVPPGEGCVIPESRVTTSCGTDGYLALSAELDPGSEAVTAEAFLHYGYYVYHDQQVTVFGRRPAELKDGVVTGRWDQQVLTLSQSPLSRILFSETRFDEDNAYHEVPLVYTPPRACACILPGDPGYADTDGDGLADCIDQDMDGDGLLDKDGAIESPTRDNCPWVVNPGQLDTNRDGTGDACSDFDARPVRACDALAESQVQYSAFWWIVTDRQTQETVSEALYIDGPSGLSQLAPEPGGRLSPMFLKNGVKGWYWDVGEPMSLDFSRPYTFRYGSVDSLPVLDVAGEPTDDDDGKLITLREHFRLNGYFMELQVANAAGEGDRVYAFGANECAPPAPPVCPPGEVRDCQGACRPEARATDLRCDDGTFGADFFCFRFRYDDGACKPPACPDGRIRSCTYTCQASPEWISDGECDGRLNCAAHDWDGGDCGCPPGCDTHGTCQDDLCVCDPGFSGVGCARPVSCGNGACEAANGEDCTSCSEDCTECRPQPCGDGICQPNAGDSCATCPEDCGSCSCGDGQCTPGEEDCGSCPRDCGNCPVCGDGVCERWLGADSPFEIDEAESCGVCPSDCGVCQGRCCYSSAESNQYFIGGGCEEPSVAECVCREDPSCCLLGWPARCVDIARNECAAACEAVPSGWTCRAAYFRDGECDCGCGVWDADCAAERVEACRYDLCPNGQRVDPQNPTQCVPEA